jgi:hypothetical protein
MYKTMLQYAYIYLKEENLGGVKAPSRPNRDQPWFLLLFPQFSVNFLVVLDFYHGIVLFDPESM